MNDSTKEPRGIVVRAGESEYLFPEADGFDWDNMGNMQVQMGGRIVAMFKTWDCVINTTASPGAASKLAS